MGLTRHAFRDVSGLKAMAAFPRACCENQCS